MARTIAEIQQAMLDEIAADAVLSGVATNSSKMAIYRLWTRIVASVAWTIEVLFDTLKAELNELLAVLKPHSLRWYAQKAKDFQYGYELPIDTDKYDNTGLTDDEIEESQIVKYSAVTEGEDSKLRIKVAKEADDLEPLDAPELEAFTEYMARVKDAGVRLLISSNTPDKLKMEWDIYYDALILNAQGQRIDGSSPTPVQDAIKNYLKNLPFNGVFVLAYMVDAIQLVDGVVIPHIKQCLTSYAAFDFTAVNVQYLPDAGYLRFEDEEVDLVVNFIPQTPLQ